MPSNVETEQVLYSVLQVQHKQLASDYSLWETQISKQLQILLLALTDMMMICGMVC